jgi:hypothetical protein
MLKELFNGFFRSFLTLLILSFDSVWIFADSFTKLFKMRLFKNFHFIEREMFIFLFSLLIIFLNDLELFVIDLKLKFDEVIFGQEIEEHSK